MKSRKIIDVDYLMESIATETEEANFEKYSTPIWESNIEDLK